MRRGKERKKAKRDRNSNIFGVVRKYLIGKEMGSKERGHKGLESIFHFNKEIDKEIYSLLPSLKTEVPKLYAYNGCEHSVISKYQIVTKQNVVVLCRKIKIGIRYRLQSIVSLPRISPTIFPWSFFKGKISRLVCLV